jgi:hypothetical protein
MTTSIIREKGVSCKGVLVQSDPAGNVTVQNGGDLDKDSQLRLTEAQALTLFENLGNMIEWKSA